MYNTLERAKNYLILLMCFFGHISLSRGLIDNLKQFDIVLGLLGLRVS